MKTLYAYWASNRWELWTETSDYRAEYIGFFKDFELVKYYARVHGYELQTV